MLNFELPQNYKKKGYIKNKLRFFYDYFTYSDLHPMFARNLKK